LRQYPPVAALIISIPNLLSHSLIILLSSSSSDFFSFKSIFILSQNFVIPHVKVVENLLCTLLLFIPLTLAFGLLS
jgi:hypothetical protein